MENLSHLSKGMMMNSSMHAGNTVSVPPDFAPVGSPSEATDGISSHSEPDIELGPNNDSQLNTKMNDAGARPVSSYTWKKV